MKTLQRFVLSALLGVVATATAFAASAQEKGCVSFKTEAKQEQHYVDAQGKQATRLVPRGKVLPGDEIVWVITATNVCSQSVSHVVIHDQVPAHMVYVADSATGASAEVAFSVDGRTFHKATDLVVTEAGKSRAAGAADIKAIRWVVGSAIKPQQSASVSFRAKVQ